MVLFQEVWSIYYSHWGKESNYLKKNQMKKKYADNIIKCILDLFLFSADFDLASWKTSRKIRQELLDAASFTLNNLEEDPMYMIYELSLLLDPQNPEEFQIKGAINRFFGNSVGYFKYGLGVSKEQAHRLDALLCLR